MPSSSFSETSDGTPRNGGSDRRNRDRGQILKMHGFSRAVITAVLPIFSSHFPVPSSQTCTPIGAKIPRQCTIEKCASLQRRTHSSLRVLEESFHRFLTTYGP